MCLSKPKTSDFVFFRFLFLFSLLIATIFLQTTTPTLSPSQLCFHEGFYVQHHPSCRRIHHVLRCPEPSPPPTKEGQIVVIMGATGTGNSELSIDLATRFFPDEIINSDKMQVYKDFDMGMATNKIPIHDRHGVIMGATGTGKFKNSLVTRFFPDEITNSDKMQVYKGLDMGMATHKIPFHDRHGVIMGATGTRKSKNSIDLATRFFPDEIINSDKMQAYKGLDMGMATDKITFHDRHGVVMGATGTGKSKNSIDLVTRFFPDEIINSDKMQVYKGLDMATDKIPFHDRHGVPHHFLGQFDTNEDGELSPFEFRELSELTISKIISHKRTPFLVRGSNSFVYSLLVEEYDPALDGLVSSNSVSNDLRYDCCFLWVDKSLPLFEYLDKRVDNMLDSGMVLDELVEFFNSEDLERDLVNGSGLRKAIG